MLEEAKKENWGCWDYRECLVTCQRKIDIKKTKWFDEWKNGEPLKKNNCESRIIPLRTGIFE